MATTTLGKVSLTMGGAYAPTATYDRLTVVYGLDGNSYCTKADGVSGIEPGVTAGWESYWQLLCESGEVQEITLVPTLTAGTKIAEITIDGTTYDLYAPSGGGGGDLPSGGNVGDVLMKTADGTEWSDDVTELKSAITQKVDDVQVNGQSVVTDGVANVPLAGSNNLGVVRVAQDNGTEMMGPVLTITSASSAWIKAGARNYNPIVPAKQHESTFYGLAKAAGDTTQSASSNAVGTYTDEAKAAIRTMLGVTGESGMNVVSLTGTVIDQTGAANTMYICGEVASLTFAAPASGICAIRFTSGTTATVATFTGVTSWMNGFDPTTLEANKVYEINILNGVGCAGWA